MHTDIKIEKFDGSMCVDIFLIKPGDLIC